VLHPFDRKNVDFPESPSRGLCGDFAQKNRSSQCVTDLRIDEMRCPQRVFFTVEPLVRHIRTTSIAEKLNEHRCIYDRHQSPRDSRMMSTIFCVVKVDPALRPLLLSRISLIVDLRLFRSSSRLM